MASDIICYTSGSSSPVSANPTIVELYDLLGRVNASLTSFLEYRAQHNFIINNRFIELPENLINTAEGIEVFNSGNNQAEELNDIYEVLRNTYRRALRDSTIDATELSNFRALMRPLDARMVGFYP